MAIQILNRKLKGSLLKSKKISIKEKLEKEKAYVRLDRLDNSIRINLNKSMMKGKKLYFKI
jgi:hypothetical protein